LRALLLRVLAWTCPRREERGFQFIDLGASGLLESLANRSLEALSLIETYDPRRFARLKRDLKRFALIDGGGEFYHHGLGAYVMDAGNMQARSIPELAAAIVHEATHARLARFGFVGAKVAERDRLERICTEAEAQFAARLPGGEALAKDIRAKLATRWWTNDALHSRRLEQLRASGLPAWLIAIYRRLFSRRHNSDESPGR